MFMIIWSFLETIIYEPLVENGSVFIVNRLDAIASNNYGQFNAHSEKAFTQNPTISIRHDSIILTI